MSDVVPPDVASPESSGSPPSQPSSPSAGQPRPKRTGWIIAAVVVVVGAALWSRQRGTPSPESGPASAITLVTSDRDDLACASENTFGRYRCEFRAPGVPWPTPPAAADRLAPYYTVDQKLYLIPGLFEQPALSARYKAEESQKLPRDQRQRFSADCQLKVVDHLANFQTRWLKTGAWNHQDEAPVATASDCHIQ